MRTTDCGWPLFELFSSELLSRLLLNNTDSMELLHCVIAAEISEEKEMPGICVFISLFIFYQLILLQFASSVDGL